MKSPRRTLMPFDTVPRDGTPFHIANVMRFNPLAKHFEVLVWDQGQTAWAKAHFCRAPTYWLKLAPLPFEIPASFAFTLQYEVRRKTWRDRLFERLSKYIPALLCEWEAVKLVRKP